MTLNLTQDDVGILEQMQNARIFSAKLSKDKMSVVIEECCDNYFSENLSKSDLDRLVAELTLLKEQIIEPEVYEGWIPIISDDKSLSHTGQLFSTKEEAMSESYPWHVIDAIYIKHTIGEK